MERPGFGQLAASGYRYYLRGRLFQPGVPASHLHSLSIFWSKIALNYNSFFVVTIKAVLRAPGPWKSTYRQSGKTWLAG